MIKMKQRKIAVIGASLVGPSVANLLRSNGYRNVTVYEALTRPHSQSGGVMGLREYTVAALSRIGIGARAVRALDSEVVGAYDLVAPKRAVYRGQSIHPGVTTSWDALYRALNGRTDVQYGKRLVSITDEGARYGLAFSDGSMDSADVVIFADGRKSFGRDALARNPLRYNGYVIWRGLAAPPDRVPVGFTRYYDTEVGRLFSVTSPLIQSGRSYWELSHNLPAVEWARVARGAPTRHAYMLPTQVTAAARSIIARHTDRLPDHFREMIEHSEVSGIPVNDVKMPERLTFRTEGGALAVLLGDAAIPPRLQVGAGLNQGLIQASELADALPADALDKWESRVLARLGPIVELGRARAHRINLGTYVPVSPGKTAAPRAGDAWGEPEWVTA